jgi:hypothetical protein
MITYSVRSGATVCSGFECYPNTVIEWLGDHHAPQMLQLRIRAVSDPAVGNQGAPQALQIAGRFCVAQLSRFLEHVLHISEIYQLVGEVAPAHRIRPAAIHQAMLAG